MKHELTYHTIVFDELIAGKLILELRNQAVILLVQTCFTGKASAMSNKIDLNDGD